MAADSLIDAYVSAFDRRVRSRRDRQDLVDEVADHLHSASERLESLGIDRETAQRRALARFGEPRLVASLLTAVPSRGSIVSLFFARRLGLMLDLATVLWFCAFVTTWFGLGGADGENWSVWRYLLSEAFITFAVLATTAALVGLNIRAVGSLDRQTITIGVIGLVSAVAAGAVAWMVGIWLPLLAIAVEWTLIRAWRMHAGSRPFTIVALVAAPVLGLGAIATTAIGLATDNGMELAIWGIIAAFSVILIAALVDVTIRLGRRARPVTAHS